MYYNSTLNKIPPVQVPYSQSNSKIFLRLQRPNIIYVNLQSKYFTEIGVIHLSQNINLCFVTCTVYKTA